VLGCILLLSKPYSSAPKLAQSVFSLSTPWRRKLVGAHH
jgi:hypothetical protein